ncbi:MAG: hypothetical protein WA633_12415 [Stellaceae bacterium]
MNTSLKLTTRRLQQKGYSALEMIHMLAPDLRTLQGRARGAQREWPKTSTAPASPSMFWFPGGVTNTPMISDAAGFDRSKLIQPEIMAPPLVWLVSDAAGNVTGRRFLAVHCDTRLPPEEAAEKAGAPVAWTSIATMPIRPGRS